MYIDLRPLKNIPFSSIIQFQISRRDYRSGRHARPLFHCKHCMEHWTHTGSLSGACDQVSGLVRGPEISLSGTAVNFLKV